MALTVITAPKEANYNLDPIHFVVETDMIDGDGDSSQPNLSMYVQIFDNGTMISELNVPFDRYSKRAYIDLGGLMDLRASLPTDDAIESYGSGGANYSLTKLSINYAEMYGDPVAIPATLDSSPEYYIIHGGTPYWYGLGPNPAVNKVLHSYISRTGRFAVKELRVNQPEWVYYFMVSGSVTVEWTIQYTDGTDDSGFAPSAPVAAAGAISYVNVGYTATGAAAAADPDKSVHLYTVNIGGAGDNTVLYYHIDDHDTEHDEYLCYDNGIGGIEVLRCSGRHETGVDVRKETYLKARVQGSNYRDGMTGTSIAVGAQQMVLNTGYYSKEYIEHLAQIIMGECWYIDRARTKIVHVTVKDRNTRLVNAADDLHAMTVTIEFDEKPVISTFLN